jgi:hypothetical protein
MAEWTPEAHANKDRWKGGIRHLCIWKSDGEVVRGRGEAFPIATGKSSVANI